MHKELIKAFHKAKYESNVALNKNIWNIIKIHRSRNARFKLFVFSITGIASLLGTIPAFNVLLKNLSQSGFYEYISIVFNGNTLSAYWKELTLSLAESLPAINIALSFSLIFIFFLSVRFISKQIIISNYKNKVYIA
jgi:hypothetical protein